MTLCTKADIEAVIQTTIDASVAVDTHIELAQGLIEGAAGRKLEVQTVTGETFSGSGGTSIFVAYWPITAITEIRVDGTALAAADYKHKADIGVIYRMSGTMRRPWELGTGNIEVDYSGGFATGNRTFEAARALCVAVCARAYRIGAAFAAAGDKSIQRISLEGSDEIEYTKAAASPDPAVFLTPDEWEQAGSLIGPSIA